MERVLRWPSPVRLACSVSAALALAFAVAGARGQTLDLGSPRAVAPGVSLFHSTDASVIGGALSVWVLRVDSAHADLRGALSNDEVIGTETVGGTAARHRAVAAVNAGFFRPNGDPAGLYTLRGRLISETNRPRGAVGILRHGDGLRLVFDRVTASASLTINAPRRPSTRVALNGIDTSTRRGALLLFTPAYGARTNAPVGDTEWILEGAPLRVKGQPRRGGTTVIPRAGFVLTYGGSKPPPALARLAPDTPVRIETRYNAAESSAAEWHAASDIVGGAGLLARDGRYIKDWSVERLNKGFVESRHPRTMIGTTADGIIWLVVVDGRQPQLSSGMTLVELRELARHLRLTNALNLDGGGSTTMWVTGAVVNSPSDLTGPRKVSDALLVFPR
jgi:hypothetical protein